MPAAAQLSTISVLVGIGFMLAAIMANMRLSKRVPLTLRARWLAMTLLTFFFLSGYVFFLINQVQELGFPLVLVTGSVFLGGAIFVFLVTNLTTVTITNIQAHEQEIEQVNRKLVQKNNDLEHEIAARQKTENNLRTITSTANDAILMMDDQGMITFWNPAAEKMFGYSETEALGRHLHALIAPDRFHEGFTRNFPTFRQLGDGAMVGKTQESFARNKAGFDFPVEISLSGVKIVERWHAVGVIRDISERRQAEEKLRQAYELLESKVKARTAELAAANACLREEISSRKKLEEKIRQDSLTDDLTGLLNRRGFLDLGEKQLQLTRRLDATLFLLYADIDNMKWINDNLGHAAGDQALVETAAILRQTFRNSDAIAIGRLGGDEFAVMMTCSTDFEYRQDLHPAGQRLQEYLARRNETGEFPYELDLSVGIAQYQPEDPCSIEEFISRADALMYASKNTKKNVYPAALQVGWP